MSASTAAADRTTGGGVEDIPLIVSAGSDSGLRIGAVRDVRPLRRQRDDQAALPKILDRPAHGADSDAQLLGQLPLTLQARARAELASLDAARDVIGDLLPHVYGPGRVHRRLITHAANVGRPAAGYPGR